MLVFRLGINHQSHVQSLHNIMPIIGVKGLVNYLLISKTRVVFADGKGKDSTHAEHDATNCRDAIFISGSRFPRVPTLCTNVQ